MQARTVAMGVGLLALAWAGTAQAQQCGNFTTYAKSIDPDQCRPAAQLEADALDFCKQSGGAFVHDFHPDKPCSQNLGNFQDGSFHCCSQPDSSNEQFTEGGKDQCRDNDDWIDLARSRCSDLGKTLAHWQVWDGCNHGHHFVRYTCAPAPSACTSYQYDDGACYRQDDWRNWAVNQCQQHGEFLGRWQTSDGNGCQSGSFRHGDYQCCPPGTKVPY